jgi:hypothetical protein
VALMVTIADTFDVANPPACPPLPAPSAAQRAAAQAAVDRVLGRSTKADDWNESLHPRDEAGRFAEVASDRAMSEEPHTSQDMQDLARGVGGKLAGFDFRIKTQESLARKIKDKMAEGMTAKQAADSVKDSLRYTVALPTEEYTNASQQVFDGLAARGYQLVDIKNYWPLGDTYSGINTNWITPGGLTIEVQVHTPESYDLKERTHIPFETYRKAETPPSVRRELYHEMAGMWDNVAVPEGALSLGRLMFEAAP